VVARVAHVITPEMATALRRQPGAGFHVVRGPRGFQEAIRGYLTRLGDRRDRAVFGGDHHIAGALEAAGFRTQLVARAEDLVLAVEESPVPVLGVVVSRAQEPDYIKAAAVIGKAAFVHGIDLVEEVDELLPRFDDQL
jgi:hypothetical protein